jgi:hypothetical protein
MTGMPAWGVTHSDEEIWSIVAFLQKLSDMSYDEYNRLSQELDIESSDDQIHQHENDGHTH